MGEFILIYCMEAQKASTRVKSLSVPKQSRAIFFFFSIKGLIWDAEALWKKHNTMISSGQFAVGHRCHSGFKSMSLCGCSTRNTTSEVQDASSFNTEKKPDSNWKTQRVICFKKLLIVNAKLLLFLHSPRQFTPSLATLSSGNCIGLNRYIVKEHSFFWSTEDEYQ